MQRQSGFTLIELAVVAAIVAVLAVIAMPLAELTVQRGKEADLRLALRQIREGLDAYKRAWDDGRITRNVTDSGYPHHLDDLVRGVVDITSPNKAKLYFLRRLPRDPFNPDPQLAPAETWGKRAYESPPDAPSAGSDVFDVHSLSDRVGLNGIPYRQW